MIAMEERELDKRLNKIEVQNIEILALLRQIQNPAAALSVERKADEMIKAIRSGDRGRLKETLKQINSS